MIYYLARQGASADNYLSSIEVEVEILLRSMQPVFGTIITKQLD